MKVSDLQDMLGMIRQMLVSASSSKAANEVAEFSAALEPFRDLTAKQFAAALLERRKESTVSKKGVKRSPAEVETIINEIRALYDRAGTHATTVGEIEERIYALSGLPKADLVRAAEGIGLKGIGRKSIQAIANEIKKRIVDRIGASQRMEMIEVVVGSAR